MSASITVYIEEEYGYRYWVWETGMSEEKLIQWWKDLPSVMPFFFSPAKSLTKLPGKLKQSKNKRVEGVWSCHLHCDDDSHLRSPKGDLTYHAGFIRD